MGEKIGEYFVRWFTGGLAYFYLEILFRGYSHYSMFILGGICFLVVGELGERIISTDKPQLVKIILIMIIGTFVITLAELITGLIVNVRFGMRIWDYSKMKYNYKGQICMLFSSIWAMVSLVCVYMDHMLKMMLFREE